MMLSYCTDVVDRVAAAAAASSDGLPRREGDLAGKTFGTDEVPTIRAGTRDVGRSEAEVLVSLGVNRGNELIDRLKRQG